MGSCGSPLIQYSKFFSNPYGLLAACGKFKLEGIVSKRLDRPYVSGRSKDWIKVKCAGWREANAGATSSSKSDANFSIAVPAAADNRDILRVRPRRP